MKRSISVPLIFLGTLSALSGCSDEPPANTEVQVKQDFYATLDDCQRDWGTEAQNCQQALTTTTVNGQDTVSSGYAGGNTTPGSSGTTSTFYSGSSYHYSGPRYFWYRHENGGYPMAVDPDGKTRSIMGSRIAESGAKFAVQSVNTKTSMPTHMTASKGVIRSGFGSFGRGASGGG